MRTREQKASGTKTTQNWIMHEWHGNSGNIIYFQANHMWIRDVNNKKQDINLKYVSCRWKSILNPSSKLIAEMFALASALGDFRSL